MKHLIYYIPIIGLIAFVVLYFTKNKATTTINPETTSKDYVDDAYSSAMFTDVSGDEYKITSVMSESEKEAVTQKKEEDLQKASLRQEYFRLYEKQAPTYASLDTLQKAIDDKSAYNAKLKVYITETGDTDLSDNKFLNVEDVERAIQANRFADEQAYENEVLSFIKYSGLSVGEVKNKYTTIKDVVQAHNELRVTAEAWKETQVKIGYAVNTFIATINDRGTAFKNNAFNTEILVQLINYSDVYAAEAERQYEVKGGVSMPDNYGGKSYHRGTMTACIGNGTATKYRGGNSTAFAFRDNYAQRAGRGLFSKKINIWGRLV